MFFGPGAEYGLIFAVVVSGIVTVVGWIVARNKQRRFEELEAQMEAEAKARQAERQSAHDRASKAGQQSKASESA